MTSTKNFEQILQNAFNDNTNTLTMDAVAGSPTGTSITMFAKDTQYSFALPTNCRRLKFQCRSANDIRYAFVTGKVATPTDSYLTLKSGKEFDSGEINMGASPSTLFLAAGSDNLVVEILCLT